jgi:dTDP-4-amino-4,6-dideoxygalactose transaminase
VFFHGSDREEVERLEKTFARSVGSKHAVCFASARAALKHIYEQYGCAGKLVTAPAYTCIPAIDAIRWAGASPHFLDIDLNSYNPGWHPGLRGIKGIGALTLSFLYGLVGEVRAFTEFARERDVPVVEDAAIAFGASFRGRKAGSIGDAAVFSLQDSKIVTAWRGGVVTTSDADLYAKLKGLQSRMPSPPAAKVIFNLSFSVLRHELSRGWTYGMTLYPLMKVMTSDALAPSLGKIMGFNPLESIDAYSPLRMPESENRIISGAQARFALETLKHADEIVAKRRKTARRLARGLDGLLEFPRENRDTKHAWGRFPVRKPGVPKRLLEKRFLDRGVETSEKYPYICPETSHVRKQWAGKRFPNASTAARETLLLPMHSMLSRSDVERVVSAAEEAVR